MKLIITGGAGFLGWHLSSRLANTFERIVILDIVPINPTEYSSNVEYFCVDVRNTEQLNGAFKGADVIIHAAAALPLWKRDDIFSINAEGTRNVLEAARNNNVTRVIYISSTAVYGVPKKHPTYENDPLVGVDYYGKSKIKAEHICEEYRKKEMRILILRPKTFIGPGRLGIFQILYDWVESGRKIPIIGNGNNHYQLLDVEDLVDAIQLFLAALAEEMNDTFNVGAEKFNTVREDINVLCSYAGMGSRILPTPAWFVKPLLALLERLKLVPLYKWVYATADTDSHVSIEKIKNRLNWSPKYSNSQALIRSYTWYLEHKKDKLLKTGVTHRSVWKQGILQAFKRLL